MINSGSKPWKLQGIQCPKPVAVAEGRGRAYGD